MQRTSLLPKPCRAHLDPLEMSPRTYLHLPRVVGDDEPQQDDGGEADKAFQGQGEHGVLQEERRGVGVSNGDGTERPPLCVY